MLKNMLNKIVFFLKKNKKIIIPAVLLIIVGGVYFKFIYLSKPNIENKKSIDVAVIADIHIGSGKNGHSESAVVHPSEYKNNLKPLLDSRPDLIITLGDNVNDNNKCHPYADDLIALFSKFNVLWGKGNHDKDCFPTFSSQNYYYHDYNNAGWRIIMLDHDIDIDNNELDWLKDVLKTDKKVLIVTHVPFSLPAGMKMSCFPNTRKRKKLFLRLET